MNPPPLAPPTLLSIAADKPDAKPSSSDGFADELSNASSRTEPKAKAPKDDATQESAASDKTPDVDEAQEAGSTAPSDDAPPAAEESSNGGDNGSTADEPTPGDGSDLLAVAVVAELLVVETPPGTQLPDEAATQIDVTFDPVPEATTRQPTEPPAEALVASPGGATTSTTQAATTAALSGEASVTPVTGQSEQDTDGEPQEQPNPEPGSAEPTGEAELFSRESTDAAKGPADAGVTDPRQADAAGKPAPAAGVDESEREPSRSPSGASQDTKPLPAPAPAPTDATAEAPTEQQAAPRETTAPPAAGGSTAERSTGVAKPGAVAPDNLPPIDPARFVSRVARAFDFAQERGGGPIEMRLSPPELGSLQVKIELKEGVLTAALEAETPAARQTLLDNLPALKDRLEQQQIRIEKFDVDVRDDSQQRGGDWRPGGESSEQQERRSEQREPAAEKPLRTEADASTEAEPPVATIDFGSDEINLVA